LAACNPAGKHNLLNELGLIKQAAHYGITASRVHGTDTAWTAWQDSCHSLHQDPWLLEVADPAPLLQIYAQRYRVGILAPSGSPVKARTLEVVLRAVGQTFSALGYPDPRMYTSGHLDFRLHRQLQSYKKLDLPPMRVKPIPLQIIQMAVFHCHRTQLPHAQTIANMLILGFFFLLRPGEYAATENPDAAPFHYCDIHLIWHDTRLNTFQCLEEHSLS